MPKISLQTNSLHCVLGIIHIGCCSFKSLSLDLDVKTLWCLINVPPTYNFFRNFPPPDVIRTPCLLVFAATVNFSNICYRWKIFKLIFVCKRYILVENEWIELCISIYSTNLHLMFENWFLNLTLPPTAPAYQNFKVSPARPTPYSLIPSLIRHCRAT